MFNRRNFAQIIASLIPLPFLKLSNLDFKEEEKNTEGLPVVKFIEDEYGYKPDTNQFSEEFKQLGKDLCKNNSSAEIRTIDAWVEEKHGIQSITAKFIYWGEIQVYLRVYLCGCEGGRTRICKSILLIPNENSKIIKLNADHTYEYELIEDISNV